VSVSLFFGFPLGFRAKPVILSLLLVHFLPRPLFLSLVFSQKMKINTYREDEYLVRPRSIWSK
jgi:hypothetical protein